MENEIQNMEPSLPQDSAGEGKSLIPANEVDREGAMAKADLYKLSQYSYKLFKKLNDEDQLESWVQAKITKAADYIASVYHYLEYEMKFSEYGHQLDNSDVLSEEEKQVLRNKLTEARAVLKQLKVSQAQKLNEAKKSKPDYLDIDKDGNKSEPFKKAVSDKKADCDLDEVAPPGKKAERMVKHIKAGYKGKDGKLTDKEKSIAYATAWKAKKAGKVEETWEEEEEESVSESKPSAGLSKKEKSEVVKKAKAGKDIGKKGKGFKDVAAKAAKQYGSKEKGEKVAAAAMWKNIKEDEELSDDVDVSEMNLKPWKKKSPFSKAGYKEVETRQKQRMKDADAAHTAADDADDEPKMKQASSDWAKAKSRAKKASVKASLAKTESTDDRDFSAKNVGLAVGNVVQGVKNTANAAVNAYNSAKTAVSDFEKGYDSASAPAQAGKPAAPVKPVAKPTQKVIKESAELDALKKLSGL